MKRLIGLAQTLLSTTGQTCRISSLFTTPSLNRRTFTLSILGSNRFSNCSLPQSEILSPLRSSLSWSLFNSDSESLRSFITFRGGSDSGSCDTMGQSRDSSSRTTDQKPEHSYTILSEPAPGSPFHHAFPVHDLQLAKEFYGIVLGCVEGRSSTKWQDYSLHGHQLVAHWVGNDYRCQDYYSNAVDGDDVPVPRT
jgi:hypothetical protein